MINIVARLQNAMHEESAAHSPGTTAAIEAMRDAITEIERLQVALGHVVDLRAEIARLRAVLREARQYVCDAGNDEDGETQTLSAALLTEIDAALTEPTP